MKKPLVAFLVVCSFGLAVVAFAQGRRHTHDHVGAYNFTVEIEGIDGGYLKVKANEEQPRIRCFEENTAAVLLTFEDDLTSSELAALNSPNLKAMKVYDSNDGAFFKVSHVDGYKSEPEGGPNALVSFTSCKSN